MAPITTIAEAARSPKEGSAHVTDPTPFRRVAAECRQRGTWRGTGRRA